MKKDFESEQKLDSELISLLQKVRFGNERRFNMLLGEKIGFNTIQELQEDLKRFHILQSYEKVFQETNFFIVIGPKNLARIWASSEEMITELEIRKRALDEIDSDPLKREITLKLINSLHHFKSLERFNAAVIFRFNAVKLMDNDKFHREDGGYRYPTQTANYLQLDKDYWEMSDNERGFFTLKQAVKPADAINSIFNDRKLVVLECHSFMLCIQYKALLDTIGAEKFNHLFKNKPLIIADALNLEGQYAKDLDEFLAYTVGAKKEDLIPGDWLYLSNFPEYNNATLSDPSKNGGGLHSMFMGNSRYRGFGTKKSMTEEEIKYDFLETYNEDFLAEPIKIIEDSINWETMGLDDEQDLVEGEEVVIYGHIDCPEREWKRVNCIYQGNGRYSCDKLKMEYVSEQEIVLALLIKHNSLLPKRKKEEDLMTLNLFRSLGTNVRGINFSHEQFDSIFQEKPSIACSATLFTPITIAALSEKIPFLHNKNELLTDFKCN